MDEPLAVGDVLHGYCGGHFGRDHYDCSRVEAMGRDWVVVRRVDFLKEESGVSCAAGDTDIAERLAPYRDEAQWHRSQDGFCAFSDRWLEDEW